MLLLMALTQAARAADCNLASMQVQFCKRCTTVIPGSTTRDTTCYGFDASSVAQAQIAMVGASIVQRPRNGVTDFG